jgi:hypothetical protein
VRLIASSWDDKTNNDARERHFIFLVIVHSSGISFSSFSVANMDSWSVQGLTIWEADRVSICATGSLLSIKDVPLFLTSLQLILRSSQTYGCISIENTINQP